MQQLGPNVYLPGQSGEVRVVYVTNPPPAVVVAPPTGCCGRRNPRLKSSAILGLSITQVILGCICIIANALDMGLGCYYIVWIYVAAGIYCGVLFNLAGWFGVAAAKTFLSGWIVTLLVFSIINAFHIGYYISMLSLELAESSWNCYSYSEKKVASQTLASIQLVCAVAELVVAIVTAVLCCSGLNCCCKTTSVQDLQQAVSYSSGQYHPDRRVVVTQQNGPYGLQQGQVVMQQKGGSAAPQTQGSTGNNTQDDEKSEPPPYPSQDSTSQHL